MTETFAERSKHQGRGDEAWLASKPCGEPNGTTAESAQDACGLSGREAAALQRAHIKASGIQVDSLDRLDASSDRVLETYAGAVNAIEDIERYAALGAAGQALIARSTVLARHASDGPEDRRDSRVHWALPWIALGASAVFDASFVSTVIKDFLNLSSGVVNELLSLLPGVGLSLGLLVVGTILGEALLRRRIARSRAPLKPPSAFAHAMTMLGSGRKVESSGEKREPDDLPWPDLTGPLLLTVAVLGLMAIWAWMRASSALGGGPVSSLGSLEPAFVVLLLVSSLTTIGLKVLAHNPYAKRDRESSKALKAAEKRCAELSVRGRDMTTVHHKAWLRLGSALTRTEHLAHASVEETCAVILETRSVPLCGGLRLSPSGQTAAGAPISDLADVPATASVTATGRAADATGLPRATVNLEPLARARHVLATCEPGVLATRLDNAVETLSAQLRSHLRPAADAGLPGLWGGEEREQDLPQAARD
jgi:hypothetical protein